MAYHVYTYFDASEHAEPSQAAMLGFWARSWAARGWKPRVLTIRNAMQHPRFSPDIECPNQLARLAAAVAKAKCMCDHWLINFSYRPKDHPLGMSNWKYFHRPGWETAPLVQFENVHSPEVIEKCGRPLRYV